MKKILVVAYGNTLRGDDGVAIHAIEALKKEQHFLDVSFVTAHQPLPELIIHLIGTDVLIFVDAQVGSVPGQIKTSILTCQQCEHDSQLLHVISPEWILWMYKKLYDREITAVLITIIGHCFDYEEGLSDIIQLRLPHLIEHIKKTIESYSELAHTS